LTIFQLNDNTILQKLRAMSEEYHEHTNNLKRLAEELSISKKIFRNYSFQMQHDSAKQSEEIMRQLTVMRNGVNETVNKLSAVVKNVLDKIGSIWETVLPVADKFNNAGYFSWLIGLISCASTLVVTLFLLVPLSCACCHVETYVGVTFIMSASVLSIFSIFLGFFAIFEVLLGGHGEVFICRSLFESPEFTIVGKLFDNPGIIYANPPVNGIFADLLTPAEHNAKQFSNTSLASALTHCQDDKSTYDTFQIENLLDLKNVLNYENYLDLVHSITAIRASEFPFISFTQKLQNIFDEILDDSIGNFTTYRLDLTQVSPEKEMGHFIDQMQRVSLQIQDTATASRMASLTSQARRLQFSMLQPLEVLKNEIIFQLTALEFLIDPWMDRVKAIRESFNQTQIYLNAHSTQICANYSENFRNRLRMNLGIFRNETLEKLQGEFGCGALFETFNGIRWLVCGHIVEPINGRSFHRS
jgi:hypothetical protein